MARIDEAVQAEMKFSGAPGLALCVINNGNVVYQQSFGLANAYTKAPVTDSTVFQLASVTKIFTALALLDELSRNHIPVTAPISTVVKRLSPGLASVTFAQLLSHQSGMMDYWPASAGCPDSLSTYFKSVGDLALFAKPGQVFSYTNNGYALAGLALATLHKTTYTRAIEDLIIKPLNLTSTSFNLYRVAYRPLASGHSIHPATGKVTPGLSDYFSSPRMQPSSGLFSTLPDLARFTTMLLNKGKLNGKAIFDERLVNDMSARHAPTFSVPAPYLSYLAYPDPSYGFGLMRFTYGGLPFVGHAGEANLQNAMLYMAPDKKFAVILLSNRGFYLFTDTFKRIVDVVLGINEPKPPVLSARKAQYQELVGNYVVPTVTNTPEEWSLIVERDGNLFMQTQDKKEFALEQIGDLSFRFTDPAFKFPLEIAFYRDESGKIAYLNYYFRTRPKVK